MFFFSLKESYEKQHGMTDHKGLRLAAGGENALGKEKPKLKTRKELSQ